MKKMYPATSLHSGVESGAIGVMSSMFVDLEVKVVTDMWV